MVIALVTALIIGGAFALLRTRMVGPPLGDEVAAMLNANMRGRIQIGSIEWPSRALWTALRGGWVQLTARDVKLWDDCEQYHALPPAIAALPCGPNEHADPARDRMRPRKLVVETPRIDAELDIHALLFGSHDIVLRNVRVTGGRVLIEQTAEPYPLHPYNRTGVSLLTAFYPRTRPAFRAGMYADSPPPIFDLRNATLSHVEVYGHFGYGAQGYAVALHAPDVSLGVTTPPANLYRDGRDPLAPKFYFSAPIATQGATLRIADEGPPDAFAMGADIARRKAAVTLTLTDLQVHKLAQLPERWAQGNYQATTLNFDLLAHTKQGAELRLHGRLADYAEGPFAGTWDVRLDARNLGPTLHDEINAQLNGRDVQAHVALSGPFIAPPKIAWHVSGLDVSVPLGGQDPAAAPLELALDELRGSVDLVNDQGRIDETRARVKEADPPGELLLAAKFDLNPYALRHISIDITKPIDAGRFLPPALANAVGVFVSGRFTGSGNTSDLFSLSEIDFSLGKNRTDRGLRLHHGEVVSVGGLAELRVSGVHVDAGQTHAKLYGAMCTGIYAGPPTDVSAADPNYDTACLRWRPTPTPAARSLAISVRHLDSLDLQTWLRRFGKSLPMTGIRNGAIRLAGELENPRVEITGDLQNVAGISELAIAGTYHDAEFVIERAATTSFGGTLQAQGAITLNGGPALRGVTVAGRNLEASRISPILQGRVNQLNANLNGRIPASTNPLAFLGLGAAALTADRLVVKGEPLRNVSLCLNPGLAPKRAPLQCRAIVPEALADCNASNRANHQCVVAHAERLAGGTVDVDATLIPGAKRGPAQIEADFTLSDLPLATLALFGAKPSVGGMLATSFRVTGSTSAPMIAGFLAVERMWALDQFIGDVAFRAQPAQLTDGQPAIGFSGAAFDGQLLVDVRLGNTPPYAIEATLTARRLELDTLVDVAKRFGLTTPVRGWVSGTVSLTAALAPPPGAPEPQAWIELTELVATIEQTDAAGRTVPLTVAAVAAPGHTARPALSLHVTPTHAAFACRQGAAITPCATRLGTPVGELALSGDISPSGFHLAAEGLLNFASAQDLVAGVVDNLAGMAELKAAISGPLTAPAYEAELRLLDVKLRPTGQDTVVRVPSGLVKLGNHSLGFTDVKLRIDDNALGDQTELVIKGGIGLDGLTPQSWGVLVEGQIAGKLLLAAAPKAFSQASGVAFIEDNLLLSGRGRWPAITGTITFNAKQPFAFMPRGLRRELALHAGTVNIGSVSTPTGRMLYTIELDQLAATIDREGRLRNINGEIDLDDFSLASADIMVDAQSVPFRVPGTMDLAISGENLHMLLPSASAPWQFSGAIAVVDGRYLRNFDVGELFRPAPPPQGSGQPFWEAYPAIGNASLDLALSVRRFSVANNIAMIDMTGELAVTGTPRDPRLAGSIKVQRGVFRMQVTRVQFTRTTGTVDFSPNRQFPSATPALALVSEADFRDQAGIDHLITLEVRGTLAQPLWDLRTSRGYNKAQTIALLFVGRTPEQIGRSLGDQSIGVDPLMGNTSTRAQSGFGDQVIRDLVGEWVSSLFRSPLEKIFRLDVLRIELSYNAIGMHGEKALLENLRAIGDAEQTFRGNTINGRLEMRTPLGINLQGAYLNKDYNDPAEQDIRGFEAKLVYRFFIP